MNAPLLLLIYTVNNDLTEWVLPLLEDWVVEERGEVQTFLERKEKQYEERRKRVQGRAVNGTLGQVKVSGEGLLGH